MDRYLVLLKQLESVFQIDLEINKPVRKLSIAERIMVELLKAFVENKKAVVLTDIRCLVQSDEIQKIHQIIKTMRKKGMAFIIIQTFEDIVFEWTDKIFTLKNGRTVGIYDSNKINREQLYGGLLANHLDVNSQNMMPITNELYADVEQKILEVDGVCTERLNDISFSLEKGEALKILVLDEESGNAFVDLFQGKDKILSGCVKVGGKKFKSRSISQSMKQGLCFIGETLSESATFENMSVKDNIAITLANKVPYMWLRRDYIRSIGIQVNDFFGENIADIKVKKIDRNRLLQVNLLKWMLFKPKVAIFVYPFHEVDLNSKEIVIDFMKMMQSIGVSLIIITSKISELDIVDGDTVYLNNGHSIDEDYMYQVLYCKNGV